MYKTAKDLRTIEFPVYALPDDCWYRQDGILFLDGQVIDESNMPGKTLGIRRLQCGRSDLFKLKKAYMNLKSMLASGKKHFVDSNGVPFTYIKTQRLALKYHRIGSIEQKETYSVVSLKGVASRFKIIRPPLGEVFWARILYYGPTPWILYDLKFERGRDSFRRV